MRKFTPETNPLQNAEKSVPYAAELDETANLIASDTVEAIKDGKMTGIEAAGRFSMATLLSGVASGKISLKDSFSFLKTLADKKTPDPVMRVEQHQSIDMRAMIVAAVESNPIALEQTVSFAFAARQQIQEKLGLTDGSLMLKTSPENSDSHASDAESRNDIPGAGSEAPVDLVNADLKETPTVTPLESHSILLRELEPTEWRPGDPPPELQNLKKELL